MFKVVTGLLVVLGLWVGVEIMHEGPTHAFGGVFKDFLPESAIAETDRPSTAQRAGNAAARARDKADARREKMLGGEY